MTDQLEHPIAHVEPRSSVQVSTSARGKRQYSIKVISGATEKEIAALVQLARWAEDEIEAGR